MFFNLKAVHGDISALTPGGVRLGTPALTSRCFREADFIKVADFLHRCVELCLKTQKLSGKMMKDFLRVLSENSEIQAEINSLKQEVEKFSASFPMPG
jgi:glycine hydroxymethyltransferase